MAVFFIPFTGTAAFFINGPEGQGVPISLVLVTFFIVRLAINWILKLKLEISPKVLLLFLILVLVVGGSLVMPVLLEGEEVILDRYSATVMYATEADLQFRFQYVTQFFYFLIGCAFSISLGMKLKNHIDLEKCIRIYMISTVVVLVLGFWQLADYYLGIPYPREIFNHLGFKGSTLFLGGRPRIYSVALEPSVMAMHLLTAIPFFFWAAYFKVKVFRFMDMRILTALLLVLLLLSFSASGFVGIAVLFILYLLYVYGANRIRRGYILATLLIVMIALVMIPQFFMLSIEKLQTFSGVERLTTLRLGWEYFSKYPLLGIGWGVFPTYDLLLSLLVGAGILGTISFVGLVLYLLTRMVAKKASTSESKFLKTALIHSFLINLVVAQVSGFNYYNQIFWFVLGLGVAIIAINLPDRQVQADPQND